jgi:Acyl transferase domain
VVIVGRDGLAAAGPAVVTAAEMSVPSAGAMLALQAGEDEAPGLLAGHEREVSVAAVNSPGSVVISGDKETALDLAAAWKSRGGKARRLAVSHAFRSPHTDAILDDFAAAARRLWYAPPAIPVISSLTGEIATTVTSGTPSGRSLSTAEFCRRLAIATGMPLAATRTFDFPTPERLAGHLLAVVTGEPAARPADRWPRSSRWRWGGAAAGDRRDVTPGPV